MYLNIDHCSENSFYASGSFGICLEWEYYSQACVVKKRLGWALFIDRQIATTSFIRLKKIWSRTNLIQYHYIRRIRNTVFVFYHLDICQFFSVPFSANWQWKRKQKQLCRDNLGIIIFTVEPSHYCTLKLFTSASSFIIMVIITIHFT